MEFKTLSKRNLSLKGMLYTLVKYTIKIGLYTYHKRIKVFGLEHIPKDKPVLFLPNHQSALIDVLLIATHCERKPYFLTRADVFSNSFLNGVFAYFRMIPIYRMRDGRNTLSNNNLIFERCTNLLAKGESLTIFPEANHNLKRRVRPLSKGFTRIILRTLEIHPELDIQLVPVGLNYKNAIHFPDEVGVYFGKPISARSLYRENDFKKSSEVIKHQITEDLKELTAHIPEEMDYEEVIKTLTNENVDFLDPTEINNKIKSYAKKGLRSADKLLKKRHKGSFLRPIFILLNLPVLLIWEFIVKPKVPEAEFMGTFRFATGLLLFPCYLIILFITLTFIFTIQIALLSIAFIGALNMVLIKFLLP